MRTSLVRIGNSRGIRIPKAIIDECGLGDAVELEIHEGHLVIRPAADSRVGWDEAFRRAGVASDDEQREWEAASLSEWDDAEWEW